MKYEHLMVAVLLVCSFARDCRSQTHQPADPDSGTYKETISVLLDSADHYSRLSLERSLSFAEEALRYAVRAHDRETEARAKLELADAYVEHDFYDLSLLFSFDALDIYEQLGHEPGRIDAIRLLGWIYYDAGQPEMALTYHQQYVDYHRKDGNRRPLAEGLNALGLEYYMKKEYGIATSHFQEALALGIAVNDSSRIAASLNNLGMVEAAIENYDKTIDYVNRAYQISLRLSAPLKQAENLNQLANAYVRKGDIGHAEASLAASYAVIQRSHANARKENLLDYYRISADLYSLKNDHKRAFEFLTRYLTLKEEIISLDKTNKLANTKLYYESNKREQKIERLEHDTRVRSLQRDFLAGIALMLGIVGVVIYKWQVNSRKKERQINEARQLLIEKDLHRASLEKEALENARLISETKKELIQKELERESFEKAALQSKLDFKDATLTNFALQVSQRNELLRTFVDELKGLKLPPAGDLSNAINKIISHFTQLQNINSDAEEFNLRIETENKDFLYILHQRFPDLTENEKRLCIQVRLNLSSKDIASINNISVKAVEMGRYRIRKRLNVDHKVNLSDFLRDLR